MAKHAEAPQSQSPYGRKLAEAARRVGVSPATLIRHIRRGRRRTDGVWDRCPATAMPGGYRVRDEDADAFYARLTADRLGASAGVVSRSPAVANRSHEAAERELAAAGF